MSIRFTSYSLDDICHLQMGKTPKRKNVEYWGKGFPWVSIADIKGKYIETTKEQITAKAIEECGCKVVRKGTLLLSFKLSIGKLAFAGTDLFTNEAIVALYIRDYDEVYPEYLYYVLRAIPLTGRNKAAKGVTLNSRSLKNIQVPIPNKYEDQIRIASLLKSIDYLIEDRANSIDALDAFQKNTFVKLFGDTGKGKHNWNIKSFSKVVNNENSKRIPIKQTDRDRREGIYPYYGATGIIDTINDYKFDGEYLLIAEDGKNLLFRKKDNAFLVKGKFWVNNHAHVLSYNGVVDLKYLEFFLNQIDFKPYISGIDQIKLNKENLDRIPVPIPPIQLQKKFASIVGKTLEIKKEYRESLNELQKLKKVINQNTFHGSISLDKMDVSKELMSLFELKENAPRYHEEEKQERRHRTTKVGNAIFANYYEDDFAILIKNHFGKFHFRFKDIEKMFAEEEEGGALTYFTTQELKRMKDKAPKDIHSFIFDCLEKKNKNLKLNHVYYDALSDLNLENIKLKAGNKKVLEQINNSQISREEISGIYFQIAR